MEEDRCTADNFFRLIEKRLERIRQLLSEVRGMSRAGVVLEGVPLKNGLREAHSTGYRVEHVMFPRIGTDAPRCSLPDRSDEDRWQATSATGVLPSRIGASSHVEWRPSTGPTSMLLLPDRNSRRKPLQVPAGGEPPLATRSAMYPAILSSAAFAYCGRL